MPSVCATYLYRQNSSIESAFLALLPVAPRPPCVSSCPSAQSLSLVSRSRSARRRGWCALLYRAMPLQTTFGVLSANGTRASSSPMARKAR